LATLQKKQWSGERDVHGTVTFRTNSSFSAALGLQIPQLKAKEVESVQRVVPGKINYFLLAQQAMTNCAASGLFRAFLEPLKFYTRDELRGNV
jgi:hypothetical protein